MINSRYRFIQGLDKFDTDFDIEMDSLLNQDLWQRARY